MPSSSSRSRKVDTTAVVLLLPLLAASYTEAYSVRYTAMTTGTNPGVMSFEAPGYCAQQDPAAHTMMPKEESYQTAAYEVAQASSFSKVPIGGEARQAACLDENCAWQFNHGLHQYNEWTFYWGVVYDGIVKARAHEMVYNNFDHGTQPVAWMNASYWGLRQPYMMADGKWANTNVVTLFTEWVCEYYEYTHSDAAIFPTYPNGDVIVPQTGSNATYVHCGKAVERDSQGRWINQRCKDPFLWWVALVIAVVSLVVVVALVITIACCCFACERKKEEKIRANNLESIMDNPARVPTQTQLGMSRQSAAASAHGIGGADAVEDEMV